MSRIRDDHYYLVFGWMLNVLDLKSNELVVFAIIYGFSQSEANEFRGSLTYLQEFANLKSQQTVINTLKSLLDKNYIVKNEYVQGNVRRVSYKYNKEYIESMKGSINDYKDKINIPHK